jgi:hypothetical protein
VLRRRGLVGEPSHESKPLVDDLGNETAPEEIVLIRKPGALERTYFPYTSPWRQAFQIRFPTATTGGRPTISANARWFGLRFAGSQGSQELRWDRDESPSRAD